MLSCKKKDDCIKVTVLKEFNSCYSKGDSHIKNQTKPNSPHLPRKLWTSSTPPPHLIPKIPFRKNA